MPRAGRQNPYAPMVIDTKAVGAQQRIRDAVMSGVGWVPADVKKPKVVRYTTSRNGQTGLKASDLMYNSSGKRVSVRASRAASTPENIQMLRANKAPEFNGESRLYAATSGWF